tara:strand:- start:8821 stop:9429 length:609 start_codon:yes stop_codon:yes gene_type:complete
MKDGVVLDLETLGSVNNSVILSVGMVAVDSTKDYTFDELIKDGYYAKLDVKSQVDAGRKIHKDTLQWWSEQGEAAQHILKPSPKDMHWSKLREDMISWLTDQGVDTHKVKVYSRGSHFDFGLLHDLFRITEGVGQDDLPWRYWNIHDSKTVVFTLLGRDVWDMGVEPEGFIHHDCLHDAAREYLTIQSALYMFQDTLSGDPF